MSRVSLFRPRPRSLSAELARQAPPALDVTLMNGDRTRRYQIRRGLDVDEWYAQVWFGETQHRGERLAGIVAAHRRLAEFRREIEQLRIDGWIERP